MAVFVDIHCHPTLKRYLYGHSIYGKGWSKRYFIHSHIQFTLPAMRKGGINVGLAAHYLPERFIRNDWRLVYLLQPILRIFKRRLYHKIEKSDSFAQTLEMIGGFEAHVAEQNKAIIAHDFKQLEQGIENSKLVFVHTLEGAHHLGRGLSVEQYEKHIEILKHKGVAMITLGHFYPNDIAYPVEGVPPKEKKLLGMRFTPLPSVPLTKVAKDVIAMLLDKGIIVDLTHTNPTARKEIFELNRNKKGSMKPLVFSHVGVRVNFNNDHHKHFALMAPDDNEILAIRECNGVIGIIFMNYWLSGKEERFFSLHKENGFNNIVNTIKHIAAITSSFDHIAIGTDFDGMGDPPGDFYTPSMLVNFKKRLYEQKDSFGASENDIDKILGKNILRVLKEVWN